jgi:hypothetical protein
VAGTLQNTRVPKKYPTEYSIFRDLTYSGIPGESDRNGSDGDLPWPLGRQLTVEPETVDDPK